MNTTMSKEMVKKVIRDNSNNSNWRWSERAEFLYRWSEIFYDRLINPIIPAGQLKLTAPIIGFESTRIGTLAYYRLGNDEVGIPDKIIFNTKYFHSTDNYKRGDYYLLETLFHELIHLWQQNRGSNPATSGYHNREFVDKCNYFGLYPKLGAGYHVQDSDGLFHALMTEYGINRPITMMVSGSGSGPLGSDNGGDNKGNSKLIKYSCPGCGLNVRVGTKREVHLMCMDCDSLLQKDE